MASEDLVGREGKVLDNQVLFGVVENTWLCRVTSITVPTSQIGGLVRELRNHVIIRIAVNLGLHSPSLQWMYIVYRESASYS